MTQNLLTQRLKAVKRELTALKTAHKRGLGELNVFKTAVTIDPSGHSGTIEFLTVTVNFDSNFAAYPLVKALPIVDSSFDRSATWLEMDYTNSGFTARAEFLWLYNSSLSNQNIYFISTAPIISTSYSWRSA